MLAKVFLIAALAGLAAGAAVSSGGAGGGARQSPIDLWATEVQDHPPFVFSNFDLPKANVQIQNLEHTVQVALPAGYRVSGGGLPADYTPLQFHLHWDADGVGSEHALYGNKYPLELHIVTIKSGYDVPTALNSGDRSALAAFGFFFEESSIDNPNLEVLINGVKEIENYDNQHTANLTSDLVLSTLLDNGQSNFGDFFRYEGGLTTPSFNEVVLWTVFDTVLSVGTAQLAKFRNVTGQNLAPAFPNFRPIQNLAGRSVGASSQKLADKQAKLLAAGTAMSQSQSKDSVSTDTVIIIFVLMAVLCIICVCGALCSLFVMRSATKK